MKWTVKRMTTEEPSTTVPQRSIVPRLNFEALGILALIVGLFASWLDVRDRIKNVDEDIDRLERRLQEQLDGRFDKVGSYINGDVTRLSTQLSALDDQLDSATISIAELRLSLTTTQAQLWPQQPGSTP